MGQAARRKRERRARGIAEIEVVCPGGNGDAGLGGLSGTTSPSPGRAAGGVLRRFLPSPKSRRMVREIERQSGVLADERPAVIIAKAFHDEYEWMAPAYNWLTQERSRVEWDDLPENQRKLMVHVVGTLLAAGYIEAGERAH